MIDGREYEQTVAAGEEETLRSVGAEAQDWGGEWQRQGAGGHLGLPVLAGLRRGRLEASVRAAPRAGQTGLILHVERATFHVHQPSLMVLALAAATSLAGLLWPFFPILVRLAPVAAVLGATAWLLVISRLQTSGPEEFLAAAAARAENPEAGVD